MTACKTRISHLLLTTALVAYSYASSAYAASQEDKWAPWVDTEIKYGKSRSLGEVDAFGPLWQDKDSMVFFNPRIRGDDHGAREYNIGAGYRRVVKDEWVLGGYGYVDRNRTPSGNYFKQVTLGAEALGKNTKLRTNAYLPYGDRRHANTGARVTALPAGLQIISNDELVQHGNDIELGYRLPIFDLEDHKQFWVYAGGYHYSGGDARSMTGSRARAELEVGSVQLADRQMRIRVGAELQHDNVRDTQWFTGLRIGIPLGEAGSSKRYEQLTPVERHMLDPIVRDVDIIVAKGADQTEDAINPATGKVFAGVITIHAGDDVAAIVAAAPENTLFLFDGSDGAIETGVPIQMRYGHTFLGGGTLAVQGVRSGVRAGFNSLLPQATVSGSIAGRGINNQEGVIRLADYITIQGLNVENTSTGNYANAIYGNGVSNAFIIDSRFSTMGDYSSAVALFGVSDSRITNSELLSHGNNRAYALLLSDSDRVEVSNNYIHTQGDLSDAIYFGSNRDFVLANNYITTSGVNTTAVNGEYNERSDIRGNIVQTTGAQSSGIFLANGQNEMIRGNSLLTTGSGIGLGGFTNINARIEDNYISTSDDNAAGIFLSSASFGQSNVTIRGNAIFTQGNNASSSGITIGSNVNADIINNQIVTGGNNAYGISVLNSGNPTVVNILYNDILTSGSGSYGINLSGFNGALDIGHNRVETTYLNAGALRLVNTPGAWVHDNLFITNQAGSHGISLQNANNTRLDNNELIARGPGSYGISFANSSNVTGSGNSYAGASGACLNNGGSSGSVMVNNIRCP